MIDRTRKDSRQPSASKCLQNCCGHVAPGAQLRLISKQYKGLTNTDVTKLRAPSPYHAAVLRRLPEEDADALGPPDASDAAKSRANSLRARPSLVRPSIFFALQSLAASDGFARGFAMKLNVKVLAYGPWCSRLALR